MAKFVVTPAMQAQVKNGRELMQRYIAFARRIGCPVVGDEIECTAKQSHLLRAWWEQETGK